MIKVFDIYLHNHILLALRERKRMNIIRIYTDDPMEAEKKSRFGYEGDEWFIPEAGRFSDENENIFIFPDGEARKKNGNTGIDIIAPCLFADALGDTIGFKSVPQWTARTRCVITEVSYPKRLSEITEGEIPSFGFDRIGEKMGMTEYVIGDVSYSTNMGIRNVFNCWWNEYMGVWRLIKKHGYPNEYVSYPVSSEEELKEIDFLQYPKLVFANPFVTIYSVRIK